MGLRAGRVTNVCTATLFWLILLDRVTEYTAVYGAIVRAKGISTIKRHTDVGNKNHYTPQSMGPNFNDLCRADYIRFHMADTKYEKFDNFKLEKCSFLLKNSTNISTEDAKHEAVEGMLISPRSCLLTLYLPEPSVPIMLRTETRREFPLYAYSPASDIQFNSASVETSTGNDEYGQKLVPLKAKLWGKGSYMFKYTKRRSLLLTLPEEYSLFGECLDRRKTVRNSRWILLSLHEDETKLAYRTSIHLLEELGLWYSAACLIELKISIKNEQVCLDDGVSAGMYLAIQFPTDAIRQFYSSNDIEVGYPLLEDHVLLWGTQKISTTLTKAFIDASATIKLEKLDNKLDTLQYHKWIAINTLLENGDYSDEMLLFIDPATGMLRFHAWDYDAVQEVCARKDEVPSNVIHCGCNPLEYNIENYMKTTYLKTLGSVLDQINGTTFKKQLDRTLREIERLSTRNEPPGTRSGCRLRRKEEGATHLLEKFEESHRVLRQNFMTES